MDKQPVYLQCEYEGPPASDPLRPTRVDARCVYYVDDQVSPASSTETPYYSGLGAQLFAFPEPQNRRFGFSSIAECSYLKPVPVTIDQIERMGRTLRSVNAKLQALYTSLGQPLSVGQQIQWLAMALNVNGLITQDKYNGDYYTWVGPAISRMVMDELLFFYPRYHTELR